MRFRLLVIIILFSFSIAKSQSLYFPPATADTWDTISPQRLNYCQSRIDSLYDYLSKKNTKSFILLKNGKIVLEKYFGTYTADSLFYWASAGKSLASFITGIAQQKGFITLNDKVSQYLGVNWTSEPLLKENLITIRELLKMTSGMEDNPPSPCSNEDTAKACLIYKVDAGIRWAYHTGAYRKLHEVVSLASSTNYNVLTTSWIKNQTGMEGFWFNHVYFSKARSMARFGLLNLNKGVWNGDTLLKDSIYFNAMINSSQTFNPAYGLLWWLNGKSSFMAPGIPLSFPGTLVPNAPADAYAALGKNDQKIYVVPSSGMVLVRQGNSAEGVSFASSNFDNVLWDYVNKLTCELSTSMQEAETATIKIFPSPANDWLTINSNQKIETARVYNLIGKEMFAELIEGENKIQVSHLTKGFYFLEISLENGSTLKQKFLKD